jgi:hypothetical protein
LVAIGPPLIFSGGFLVAFGFQSFALECKIGAAARNANETYRQYGECVPELASRFGAKNTRADRASLGLDWCGAEVWLCIRVALMAILC